MTRQESFKRRVRARMAKTGERYGAARRSLLEPVDREWVSEPDVADATVTETTGRDWNGWCAVIDQFPGRADGHAAIARHLRDDHGVDAWWAQTITVGYERIRGLRLRYQQPDGTFTASRSATIGVNDAEIRALLLDDRDALFPGMETELRSRRESRAIRIMVGPGVAEFGLRPGAAGRTRVSVAHVGLTTPDEVETWREFWADWLSTLKASAEE